MKAKAAAVLFSLLFAVGFGAGGVSGLYSLGNQLNDWWQARSWQAVPATVVEAELKESRGDDATTYRVIATYRYAFDGRSYDGTRIGFSNGSDNIGSWQRDQYMRLAAARREGRSIEVWIDPAHPERSIVNRDLRWQLIAFTVPFATLFPLLSIAAIWMLLISLRTPAQEFSAPAKLETNAREIRSDARTSMRTWWIFATFWSLIAFPVAFVFVPEQFGRSWMWLLVMLFPVVGVGLIWIAATRTLRFVRNGEVILVLSPTQPQLGESITVRLQFAQTAPTGEYAVALVCEEVDTRGDSTKQRTLWQQDRGIQVYGPHASTSFLPPAHLPPSLPRADIYHRWRVLLKFPGAKDERGFDLIIGPARASAAA